MIVKHAKDVARQWVIEEASQVPGFYGAFYHGSTNWLPDDAPFPATSDVAVSKDYAKRQWVYKRCERARDKVLPRVWEVTEAIMAANPGIED
jgi:hypothetical protein